MATLVKLLLPDLFAGHYDSLLYLDCDLTIHADVSQLFRLDIGACPVAAQRRGMLFFNGVLDGRFASLSPVWNMMPPRRWMTAFSRINEPGIVHYAGFDKPWKRFGHDKLLFKSGLRPAR